MSQLPEHQDVVAAVNHYLSGIKNANQARESLSLAFYSSTNLHSLDENGELHFLPRDGLVELAASGGVPEHSSEIMGVEVTNDMAFAKVHIDLPDRHYYDYLTLLKMKVGWRIVSKTYTTVMK
ncbi:MAG: nuclear transport factor 2 family protein [Acidiferrobacterales bacterium]|nr:nuclear transport factor 2 family protein [Acidiferrobacterales bacterium]